MARNTAIDYLNREIVNIKHDIEVLSKLIRDGNGSPSLIQQVTTLNIEMRNVQEELKKELSELKDMVKSSRQTNAESERNSWQFKTAIAVVVVSSLTSIYLNMQNGDRRKQDQAIVELTQKIDKLSTQTVKK
jgi:maltooligosyltrehalose synthase